MGKLLRILVIFILLFSIGALVLGILLFGKRELLKGRTRKLEDTIIALGTTVEAKGPDKVVAKPDYTARDMSPVTSEILDTPELSPFWDSYKVHLEQQDLGVLDINSRRRELMNYYKIDPETGAIQRDERGYKMTTGEGTMQSVLDELLARAEAQHNLLNETRQQLKVVREELVSTIQELNSNKRERRENLKKIEDLEAEVRRLEGEIRTLKQRIAELTEEKERLETEVGEQKRQIAFLEEEKNEKDIKIAELEKEIQRLQLISTTRGGTGGGGAAKPEWTPQVGVKGEVMTVNPDWNFIVIKLTDEFIAEIFEGDHTGSISGMELMVRRPGEPGSFVAKLRMISVRQADKVGVADIDTDWQQLPVEKGDVVFFQ